MEEETKKFLKLVDDSIAGKTEIVNTEEEAKFWRDKHVLEAVWKKMNSKSTAIGLLCVSAENYDKIRGVEEPIEKEEGYMFQEFGSQTDFYQIVKTFVEIQPIYYDSAKLWWVWNNKDKCWVQKDETDILNAIDRYVRYPNTTSDIKNQLLEAFRRIGRKNAPRPMKRTWVQFKDIIVDVSNGDEFPASPDYFTVNPIPYSLHKEKFIETPAMDKLFEEWVGKENVKLLYQIIAYCLIPDYPIHRLFCLIGAGMNGKSCYLRIIEKFVGNSNICSTELDTLMTSRFESSKLFKKLVCIMGETNFNELRETSMLKKLTGQDTIGFEYKGKNQFDDRNYAKILIATNNLPETTDKTIGFYRRWCIIDFPNLFSEDEDVLKRIPEEEYESLAIKCGFILHELLVDRKFHNEGGLVERQQRYEDKSNPLEKFLKENVEEEVNGDIPCWELIKRYNEWAKANKYREMSEHAIGNGMKRKGLEQQRMMKDWFENGQGTKKLFRCWVGVKWKQ